MGVPQLTMDLDLPPEQLKVVATGNQGSGKEHLTQAFLQVQQQKGDPAPFARGPYDVALDAAHKGTYDVDGTSVDWWECEWQGSASAMEDADVILVAFDLRDRNTLSFPPSFPGASSCCILVGLQHDGWMKDTTGHVNEADVHQVAARLQPRAVVFADLQSDYNMHELRKQIMRVGTAHAKCETLPAWSPNTDEAIPESTIAKEGKDEGVCAACTLS